MSGAWREPQTWCAYEQCDISVCSHKDFHEALDQARAERDEEKAVATKWAGECGLAHADLLKQSALVVRLREALERAKDTIRVWHGITMELDEEEAWALYQESPEMKQINAALVRPDAPPARGEQG